MQCTLGFEVEQPYFRKLLGTVTNPEIMRDPEMWISGISARFLAIDEKSDTFVPQNFGITTPYLRTRQTIEKLYLVYEKYR